MNSFLSSSEKNLPLFIGIFFSTILFAILFFIAQYSLVKTDNLSAIPVAYQGRIRPFTEYSQLWLYDLYHHQTIKRNHTPLFPTRDSKDLILTLHFFGHTPLDESPLFWVASSNTQPTGYMNYLELNDGSTSLGTKLSEYSSLKGVKLELEKTYQNRLSNLKNKETARKEISLLLENELPLRKRLTAAGSILKLLPGRFPNGEWFSPHAFKVRVYDQKQDRLVTAGNFTRFTNETFKSLKSKYLDWEKATLEGSSDAQLKKNSFFNYLLASYDKELAGKPYQEAFEKSLNYPSLFQLHLEALYYDYPWLEGIIFLYAAALILFILNCNKTGLFSMGLAFALHTVILIMRCLILGRAPVSNMFETIFYVPWVAVFVSLFLRHRTLLLASSSSALILLALLPVIGMRDGLENVQAVLDSQFWLVIHVLMIVGSYGIFILAGLLGHFYLAQFFFHRKETNQMIFLGRLILQLMYLGTGLLVSGTILGGVWAAESWGRFWDWDPKESWAFISSCIYLIWIHAYRFKKISDFGLAVGSIIGLLSISFTWYGVNYLLGTGLHSYGFGQGGELIYYLFVLTEILILSLLLNVRFSRTRNSS